MLFYADKHREIDPTASLQEIDRTLLDARLDCPPDGLCPGRWALKHHARLVGAAIAIGEIHQAIADGLCPEADDAFPETDLLAEVGILIGRCVYRSWQAISHQRSAVRTQDSGPRALQNSEPLSVIGYQSSAGLSELLGSAERAVAQVAALDIPTRLQVKIPEGYAFYSLYPEMYFSSLLRVLRESPEQSRFAVVGIRSIGTSLATLVAGALREVGVVAHVETLRPRGHPFDRFINVAPTLQRRLLDACISSSFLVVDEGPGLTCSSFLSICSELERLGASKQQMSVLSAWRGAPSIYASDEMRARWAALRVYHTDASDAFDGWKSLLPLVTTALEENGASCSVTASGCAVEDLSYGRWRERAYRSADLWPTIHRSAERTKLLIQCRGTGDRGQVSQSHILAKFAGLGDYGKEKLARAEALATAGFSPPVAGLAYGFLLQTYVEGRPLEASDLTDRLTARLVEYYAFVAKRFTMPPAPRFDPLAEMILLNTREAVELDASGFIKRWSRMRGKIDNLPLAQLDGRPFPHDWLEVTDGALPVYLKTDSADHCRDHSLVGEQSILWDLAGACEEWEMGPDQTGRLLSLWEANTGDVAARTLLDFFRAAYLAFRTAALHYAIHSTNEDDIRRGLQHQQWKVNTRLKAVLSSEFWVLGSGF